MKWSQRQWKIKKLCNILCIRIYCKRLNVFCLTPTNTDEFFSTQNDDELIEHNKKMLHAFYGLMKLFCVHSDKFAEMVMAHDNLDFACKSVTTVESYMNVNKKLQSLEDVPIGQFFRRKRKFLIRSTFVFEKRRIKKKNWKFIGKKFFIRI